MKKLILTLLLSITSIICVWAQEGQDDEQRPSQIAPSGQVAPEDVHKEHTGKPQTTSVRPPNYGSLLIDWGFNFLRNCPAVMESKDVGARFVNLGLFYNIRLGHSHFTISPGIGLSYEGYRLQKDHTLERHATSRNTIFKTDSSNSKSTLSSLDVRYVNLMLEARFNANSTYPKESLFVALGFQAGMLWKACATVRYKEDNEVKERNSWETFNLNSARYGAHARLGWSRLGVCYIYMFSNLFDKNKGPNSTTTNTHHVGISIDIF